MASLIDYSSPLPYYAQVKENLRRRIERGEWQPGDQIPSEAEFCDLFGVSRIVIRQALGELADEGLVMRRKGKGTFVAQPKLVGGLVQRLAGFFEDMTARGHRVATQVLKQEALPAGARVAGYLELTPEATVIQLDRLRWVDGEPIVLVTTYLPHALAPGLLQEDLSRQSLYEVLARRFGLVVARGRRVIGAIAAGAREAALLQIDEGAPLICLDSVSYLDDGTPLEYYHALHRGDRSSFEVELLRIPEQGRTAGARGRQAAARSFDRGDDPLPHPRKPRRGSPETG